MRLEADGYEVVRLGQDLAAGRPSHGAGEQAQLFGLVPVAVRALVRMGVRRDPSDSPQLDPMTSRGYFSRYPAVLG